MRALPNGRDILAVATRELGIRESPANSNRVKYNAWYYGREVSGAAYPWCMAFVQWCYAQAGAPLPYKTASCGELLRWYRKNQPECVTDKPVPGCIVIFDFPSTGSATDHTGLFVSKSDTKLTTIDGNTSGANQSNGGWVQRKTRGLAYANPTYIVPRELKDEQEEETMEKRYNTIEEIRAGAPWAAATVEKLMQRDILRGGDRGLDLSADMLRLLVLNDRAELYD